MLKRELIKVPGGNQSCSDNSWRLNNTGQSVVSSETNELNNEPEMNKRGLPKRNAAKVAEKLFVKMCREVPLLEKVLHRYAWNQWDQDEDNWPESYSVEDGEVSALERSESTPVWPYFHGFIEEEVNNIIFPTQSKTPDEPRSARNADVATPRFSSRLARKPEVNYRI